MRKFLAVLLVFSFTAYMPLTEIAARAEEFPAPAAWQNQDQYYSYQLFSREQLDNLLAPVALYPDPLLAQVLLAATFPDQIDEADRELRANYDHYDVDSSYWDVSVKAVAHYPAVLHMMADKLDWTTSLGQAYVSQSTDVMAAVQRLRRRSRNAGYLVTTRQMEVIERDDYIYVWPAEPRYIYVPVYDPVIVYYPRPRFFTGVVIGFGVGFIIGSWLNHDCDWREQRVYYHGWDRDDDGWARRSRPFVQVNNIYVNNTYVNVTVNQTVINRTVNYNSLDRYNSIHRDVHYDNVRANPAQGRVPINRMGPPETRPVQDDQRNRGDRGGQGQNNRGADNKIIDRNINTRDPRIDANRGRAPVIPTPQRPQDLPPAQNRTNTGGQLPPVRQLPPTQQRPEDVRPDRNRTNTGQPPPQIPPTQHPQDVRPDRNRIDTNQQPPNRTVNQPPSRNVDRPVYQPPPRNVDRPNTSVFGGNRPAVITPQDSSQRGQNSRTEMSKPASPPPNRGGGGGGQQAGADRQGGGGQQGGGNKPSGDKPKGGDKPNDRRPK